MSFKTEVKNFYLKLSFRLLLQLTYYFCIAHKILENAPKLSNPPMSFPEE